MHADPLIQGKLHTYKKDNRIAELKTLKIKKANIIKHSLTAEIKQKIDIEIKIEAKSEKQTKITEIKIEIERTEEKHFIEKHTHDEATIIICVVE